MFVNSVSTGLSPSYGLRSGDNAQSARPAALAKEIPERSFAAEVGAARDASAAIDNGTDVGQVQSTLKNARRHSGATAEQQTGKTSDSPGGRSPPGIALYQRISQYDNNEPAASSLLKSWNEIMQGGQDAESGVAAFAKALSQNQTSGLESGILDLTA